MAFLTIAGVEYSVIEFKERPVEIVGVKRRSFNGTLRMSVSGEVRSWSGTLLEMTEAAFTTLRNATKMGANVAVAGDAMPASTTCVVELGGAEYMRNGASFLLAVPFVAEAVNPTT